MSRMWREARRSRLTPGISRANRKRTARCVSWFPQMFVWRAWPWYTGPRPARRGLRAGCRWRPSRWSLTVERPAGGPACSGAIRRHSRLLGAGILAGGSGRDRSVYPVRLGRDQPSAGSGRFGRLVPGRDGGLGPMAVCRRRDGLSFRNREGLAVLGRERVHIRHRTLGVLRDTGAKPLSAWPVMVRLAGQPAGGGPILHVSRKGLLAVPGWAGARTRPVPL